MRRLLAVSIFAAAVLAPLGASADTAACLNASEKGQRARSAGRLREAREQFQVCGAEGCPTMVRKDCTQWQGEVMNTLPSVVFGAKDKQGRDLFDVSVTMDGESIVKKLDGKAVPVDPGPHTFKFEVQGSPAVIEKALVKEGEKARAITVSFGDAGGAAPVSEAAPSAKVPDRPSGDEGGHTVLPWVVVGVGAAVLVSGIVVLLASPVTPEGCSKETKTCVKIANESAQEFADRQDRAGRAEAQPTEGLLVAGIGLAVACGGLLWHFLEPTGGGRDRASAVRFTPWAAPGSAGATLGARF